MERLCQKCNQPVPQEAFLCPHCGAILDTSAPKPMEEKPKKVCMIPYRYIFSVILALMLVAAVVILIGSVLKHIGPKDPTVPTQTTVPPTTTEPVPLVPYEVKVRTDNRKNLKGIWVEVCKDGEVLYACESGSYGSATFILPQQDGYTIRLSKLPMPFEALYSTREFPFEPGQQNLEILLESSRVNYTVRVVNREGEPLADTTMNFFGFTRSVSSTSDQQGTCVFEDKYVDGSCPVVYLLSYPTGYQSARVVYEFDRESLTLTIVLDRYGELELPEGHTVYQVLVKDEFGKPITGLDTVVTVDNDMGSTLNSIVGYTNSDGVFSFIGSKDEDYTVLFPKDPDYSQLPFPFEDGVYEQEITLQTENPTGLYTYTIKCHDQNMQDVPGVMVLYQQPDGSYEYFTSDEKGLIEMALPEEDPAKVTVMVVSVPDGYDSTIHNKTYTFNKYSRAMAIAVIYVKPVTVTINVVDQYGDPVLDATLAVRDYIDPSNEVYYVVDEKGVVQVELDPKSYYSAWIYDCPMGYTSDETFQYLFSSKTEYTFVLNRLPLETYTLKFLDEQGNPVPGVSIMVRAAIGSQMYTSDDNGIVTFEYYAYHDFMNGFVVQEIPEGYVLQAYPNPHPDEPLYYSIPADVTTMVVLLVSTN